MSRPTPPAPPTALPTAAFPAVTPPPATSIGAGAQVLRLATTTGLAATGLLQTLLPGFSGTNNARVDVLAVSGAQAVAQAVALGAAGQADIEHHPTDVSMMFNFRRYS